MKQYNGTAVSPPWGVREDQHMLATLPAEEPRFYAGPIHGGLDGPTMAAYRHFQEDKGLKVTGQPTLDTRKALVADYMAIDGTSLPKGTRIEIHGCGEHHQAVRTRRRE